MILLILISYLIFGLGSDIVREKLKSLGFEGLNQTMSW